MSSGEAKVISESHLITHNMILLALFTSHSYLAQARRGVRDSTVLATNLRFTPDLSLTSSKESVGPPIPFFFPPSVSQLWEVRTLFLTFSTQHSAAPQFIQQHFNGGRKWNH